MQVQWRVLSTLGGVAIVTTEQWAPVGTHSHMPPHTGCFCWHAEPINIPSSDTDINTETFATHKYQPEKTMNYAVLTTQVHKLIFQTSREPARCVVCIAASAGNYGATLHTTRSLAVTTC